MDKVAYISGASRGIGRAIALKLANEGYHIVIAAKTTSAHSKLPGTIYSVAQEVEALGVKALPLKTDIRFEENVVEGLQKVEAQFGRLDVLVNNASAINLSSTENLPMKRFDLMHDINVRGTFMVSKHSIALLKKSNNPHILTLSPPLSLKSAWFGAHLGYTMSKYGMSMTVLGLANELKKYNIAVNALWPKSTIATAAIEFGYGGKDIMEMSRSPQIMADAAWAIIQQENHTCTGNFFIDEAILQSIGITDFSKYAINPEKDLMKDLFVE